MAEKPTERDFEVLSKKYHGYKVGDTVTLLLTDNQELSLLESGAVKRATVRLVRLDVEHKTENSKGPSPSEPRRES